MKKHPSSIATTSVPSPKIAFIKARPFASRLGVSAKTIFRQADAGLISRRRFNARFVLFDVSEVVNLVERCRVA